MGIQKRGRSGKIQIRKSSPAENRRRCRRLSSSRRKLLMKLYPECHPEEEAAKQDARRIRAAAVCLIAGGILAIAVFSAGKAPAIRQLFRPEPGEGSRREVLYIEKDGIQDMVELEIAERQLTQREREERLDQAEAAMRQLVLGENPDADHVTLPLNLNAECPVDGISAWWNPKDMNLVHPDGTIASGFGSGEDGRETILELNLSDGTEERTIPVTIRLFDGEAAGKSGNGAWKMALEQAEAEHREESVIHLPAEIEGQSVTYRQEEGIPVICFPVLGLLAAVGCWFYPEQKMKEEAKKREEELAVSYSEFVAKIRILTGAGLSVRNTWKRLAESYEEERAKGGKRKILYEEVCRTERELTQGALEEGAYSRFAARIGQGAYLRLGGLLESHRKNGSKGFSSLLEAESAEAFREQLQLARRQGERISGRLLIPLLMLFALVLVLLMVPAFFSL